MTWAKLEDDLGWLLLIVVALPFLLPLWIVDKLTEEKMTGPECSFCRRPLIHFECGEYHCTNSNCPNSVTRWTETTVIHR